jgi:hypothetical protein
MKEVYKDKELNRVYNIGEENGLDQYHYGSSTKPFLVIGDRKSIVNLSDRLSDLEDKVNDMEDILKYMHGDASLPESIIAEIEEVLSDR